MSVPPPSYLSSTNATYRSPELAATLPPSPDAPPGGQMLGTWLTARESQAAAKVRLPLILGAHRIGLADRRVQEIQSHLEETRTRLLNLPGWTDPGITRGLEERAARLEEELHRERLTLWKDLLPLAEQAGDAVIDSLRSAWLSELTRTMGGDGH